MSRQGWFLSFIRASLPVYGIQAWTTSFVVKRKWIEMLITPCFCGEDFWFIVLSRTISGRWLHSAIQPRVGEVLKTLPSSFIAIVNKTSACRIDFHNLRCLMPEGIAGTQKAKYFISLTEAITRTDRDNFGANTKNSFNWAITRATFFSWQLWFMPSIYSPHRLSSCRCLHARAGIFGSYHGAACEAEKCVKVENVF